MNYQQMAPSTVESIYSAYKTLDDASLATECLLLIQLLISQINGCAFCIKLHTREALDADIDTQKISNICKYAVSPEFSDKERIMLAWCEKVNSGGKESHHDKPDLFEWFSPTEVVDMTIATGLIGLLNKMAIYLK